jgi:hypothetical protein
MTQPSRRQAVATALAACALLALTGCTDTGAITCDEFQAQSIVERGETLSDLLREHDLEPNDVGNIQGVNAAVSQLCSSGGTATLEQATDWDSDTW